MTTAIHNHASDSDVWHAIHADEVLRRLDSNTQTGLDLGEVSRRLARYGPNPLPEGRRRGPFVRLLMQLNNILIYVLIGAGFIKLMLGLWLDAAIVLGVVVINALLGFIQEGKAEKTLDAIRYLLSTEARTLRGEEVRMVPAEGLVPGDIVLLESGDKIPADLRQGLVIMAAIFLGFTSPITTPQILWVNMVTSVALGFVISFEPHEKDVMRRPPRAVDCPIVGAFGVWRIVFVGFALLGLTLWAFFWMKSEGASDELARAAAVNALVIGQIFYLLNSRYKLDPSVSPKAHRGNKYLPMGIGTVIVLQLLFTYAHPLQTLFDTEAVPLRVWPRLVLAGLVFFFVVETEKLIIRKMRSGAAPSLPAPAST